MDQLLTTEALQYACQRVEDFALVNRGRNNDEKEVAVDIWLEGIGLDESLKLELAHWIDRFLGPDWNGAVLIGLAVGLFINQWNHDHP